MQRFLVLLLVLALSACGEGGLGAPNVEQLSFGSSAATHARDNTPDVAIAGYYSNHTIALTDSGVVVTNKVNGSKQTYPTSIRTIRFVDKHVSFDVAGSGGQVYRLYQAAFNRKPDGGGLGYWIKSARKGVPLSDIAASFINSAEFKTLYGENLSAELFVGALYQNILHRIPDRAGYDWWVNSIKNGADRAGVLVNFAESQENKDAVDPLIMAGFAYDYSGESGDPLLPASTSYANKMAAGAVLGAQGFPRDTGDAVAFADFFQDGSYSLVTNTLEYDNTNIATNTKFGHIKFYKSVNGSWVEKTSALLSDNVGCLHPRKALVADFNGDGKPDVFIACHGFDAAPFPGEKQRVLLSQSDGTYQNVTTAFECFCHGASAAVLNRQGYADILVADQTVEKRPYFLINNGDGTFTRDTSRLPSLDDKQIWTAELIDFDGDGKIDAFLAGADPQGDGYQISPTVFVNDGSNVFTGKKIEFALRQPKRGYATLDIVFNNGAAYLLRTDYASMEVQKIDLKANLATLIYGHSGAYPGTASAWFPWLTMSNNKLMTFDSRFNVNIDP
ncbi:MAG: DUF4214 domain-containing protein [Telluria sp.]